VCDFSFLHGTAAQLFINLPRYIDAQTFRHFRHHPAAAGYDAASAGNFKIISGVSAEKGVRLVFMVTIVTLNSIESGLINH
jgi:hypothetical protein